MSSPKQEEEMKLRRIRKFFRKRPTTTYRYEWQDHPGELTRCPNNDWVDCKVIRISTSGGGEEGLLCTVRIFYTTVHGLKLV